MSQNINQLCQNIAKHPSQINLLNQVLTLSLQAPNPHDFLIILDLITFLKKEQKVAQFLDNKNQVIFITLLDLFEEDQGVAKKALEKCFDISGQQGRLVEEFLDWGNKSQMQWTAGWPANLLTAVFDHLSSLIDHQKDVKWDFIINLVLTLPSFSELEIHTDLEPLFKKNFQKLVLSILASEQCPTASLQQLYHGIGTKVLSKMSQPLALASHCLHRFAQNPEIQIEVLSLLFLLVGKYGLELQEFYPKLETLIRYRKKTHSIYELPNSRRFFKLVQVSLRSSRVPFKTVSTFAHILIRQLSGQTGQFAFWALSFIVNLIKKHRKLLDELPSMPQLQALKHHYNGKVRSLVGELFKNLNKIDYLQIEDFTKVSMASLTEKKLSTALASLENDDLQFKVPVFEEPL